ncbi:hypothetical protein MSG28_010083 [Choristoneura fumiferana]|uniref:Uncharacterized protein n=1 Tax=Choristoneura fumiferana TaxID=7141 RepID=A0ACC0KJ38_CHOFU|nr:hypothetical protein MSG28_010083 [Choristoneura fumiferana]
MVVAIRVDLAQEAGGAWVARGAVRGRARQVTGGERGSCGRRALAARGRQALMREGLTNRAVAGDGGPAARAPVKTFQAYLPPAHRTYSCIHCRAHLASHDELISKSFQGSQGRAYLFNSVVNVGCGPAEERVLLTGLHAVADIYCDCCKTMLGWKYEHAFESSQKYKEGKFIIELAHMVKENGWD